MMGKMKALLIDNMENVKTYPLSTILEEEQDEHEVVSLQQEAHYYHTIHNFVELIVWYGSAKVLEDLDKALLGAKA
jgi:hypothetical protein